MMKIRILIWCLCLTVTTAAQVTVQHMRCEQLKNPIGVATATPNFSWQLYSKSRNVKQQAYQIIVSSSKERAEKNIGDIWDSGEVLSDETLFIRYQGRPLASNRYYYWRVRSITNKGEAWSAPAYFTIGLLQSSQWKAQWIGYDNAFPWDSISQWSRLSARYFRKEFTSSKKIKKAFVNIVGLGLYELYINGNKIGEQVLAPAPTDYRKSVFSNTFDVTAHITSGTNAIGVILGNGRFFTMRQQYKPQKINNFGFPKFLLQLDIIYEDGATTQVLSDKSWKFTADGPIRTNNEYDGEEYDATKELGDWTKVGYNDKEWLQPQLVSAPQGNIIPQPNPFMKIMKRIAPVKLNKLREGIYILDMGQNFAGWLQIRVKGKRGDKVKLRFSESLQSDGELYVANLRDARVTDIYTLKGEGIEVWHPRFVYHGFRYVEISGWPGIPKLSDFEGHVIYDDMNDTGNLETSSETINKIIRNSWWGIASNYKGMPVDCPQRNERQPWLGDRAQGAYGESFLFDNQALYVKWLDDIRESQTEEGAIPDVAPAYWNYYSDNMTWPGVYLLVADMLYRQYGNKGVITAHYPFMKKWLTYMKRKYLKNYILTKDKYGDWCVPPEDLTIIRSQDSTRTTDGHLIATAYYYHFLQLMKSFAALSENIKDIEMYEQESKKVLEAFNNKFFNAQSCNYDNGTITANLLPLYFGLVPSDKKACVFDRIIKKMEADQMHISTGVIGTQWLMRGLTHYGRADAALTLATNTTYPSWGYMIANGATTIWELWNGNMASPQMNSQNHVMLLGDLLIWLFENVAGVKAARPAFKQIEMQPLFIPGLEYVRASYKSAYGLIRSSWQLEKEKIKWHIEIPANTNAIIKIPTNDPSSIKENGIPASQVEGVTLLEYKKGFAVFSLSSGSFQFEN